MAREKAKYWSENARGLEQKPKRGGNTSAVSPGETVSEYFARWNAARDVRGLVSIHKEASTFRIHIEPIIGMKPIASVTRADIEAVVEAMDAKVAAGSHSWQTMQRAWVIATKMFKDTLRSKIAALRVRGDNPCADVAGPDRGAERAKSYLYPSEFLALMNSDRVPLHWRRMIALAVYLYVRAGELEALRWSDVDLDHGVINVNRGMDRLRAREKSTKGKLARRFAIEENLLPVLRAMKAKADPDALVIRMVCGQSLARILRRYLKFAGVTRPELFADDETRKPITFHDLRATGITWMAIRGDDPIKIMRRAGHADFATTQRYVREAEQLAGRFEPVFPPLPASLLGDGDHDDPSVNRQDASETSEIQANTSPRLGDVDRPDVRLVHVDAELYAERVVQHLGGQRRPVLEQLHQGFMGD
ncbi:site-specific integrase [Sorangium sp. So ce834]|uniref:tyrosine-type recombinase/integrase n=1 Tax=Sorangium sp. So ce834 TaxID=3133321 RepID=UPI003F6007D9